MPAHRNPGLAADSIVIRDGEQGTELLLISRGKDPFKGKLAFPGGFVEHGEDPEVACLRELKEETNITGDSVHLIAVAGDPKRDPRGHTVSIIYAVTTKTQALEELKFGDDAAEAQFYPIKDIIKKAEAGDLAFDHGDILINNVIPHLQNQDNLSKISNFALKI
ncbi:ADP-ribose pyrophosphatase [Acrasis kona]|uniref:ADP-ribose pyrophosphatase n=1 Tax=Acrasis kona TaxID=1008807 RepID=A0AAW2YZB5_9EUKA